MEADHSRSMLRHSQAFNAAKRNSYMCTVKRPLMLWNHFMEFASPGPRMEVGRPLRTAHAEESSGGRLSMLIKRCDALTIKVRGIEPHMTDRRREWGSRTVHTLAECQASSTGIEVAPPSHTSEQRATRPCLARCRHEYEIAESGPQCGT